MSSLLILLSKAIAVMINYPWQEVVSPANIPSWVLAFVAILAAWVSYKSMQASKQQANEFVNKERAKLVVGTRLYVTEGSNILLPSPYPNSNMPISRHNIWNFEFRISNIGETCAIIRSAFSNIFILPLGSDIKKEFIDNRLRLSLPVKVAKSASVENKIAITIDGEKVQKILNGTVHLFVIGHIEYEDVFGHLWAIKFCRQLSIEQNRHKNKYICADILAEYEPTPDSKSPMNGEFLVHK